MNSKQRFLEQVLASGRRQGIISAGDVLRHVDPDVLAEQLPEHLRAAVLAASLAASSMTPELVVDTVGVTALAEHIPVHILWACIAEAGADTAVQSDDRAATATVTARIAPVAAIPKSIAAKPKPAAAPDAAAAAKDSVKSVAKSSASSATKASANSAVKAASKSPAKSASKSAAKSPAKSAAKSPAKSAAKSPAKSASKSPEKASSKSQVKAATKSPAPADAVSKSAPAVPGGGSDQARAQTAKEPQGLPELEEPPELPAPPVPGGFASASSAVPPSAGKPKAKPNVRATVKDMPASAANQSRIPTRSEFDVDTDIGEAWESDVMVEEFEIVDEADELGAGPLDAGDWSTEDATRAGDPPPDRKR